MSMLSRAKALRPAAFAVLLATCTTSTPTPSAESSPSAVATAGAPDCPPVQLNNDLPSWADEVYYELFIRSFADGDGDGIGDLAGLTEHLDYLNDGDPATKDDLGVTGLWLMPVAESPSYHGYDVTDYTTIERDYGTAADFRRFIEAAHQRGIHVIVDFVVNHTSRNHPWFRDAEIPGSAHDDWYVWSDTDPGWPPAAGPKPWHRDGDRFYYGVFWEGMPDLNLRNDAVTAELERIADVWLEDYGVDGFRLDAAKHLIEDGPLAQVNTPETHAWLQGFRQSVHDSVARIGTPGRGLVLGEVWDARATTVSYVADGSLDLTFDFGIGPAIENAVQLGDSNTLDATQAELADRYPAGSVATFLTNHDQPRVMTELRGKVDQATQAAAALLTGPGVPFLYYGEELGMTGTKPDEQIRTPLPWTAEGPGFGFTPGAPWESFADGAETANVATEAADARSLLSTYRRLVGLRSAYPSLATGDVLRATASEPGVSAVLRTSGHESLLVVHNLRAEAVRNVTITIAASPLCGTTTGDLLYASGPFDVPNPPSFGAGGRLDAWSLGPVLPAHSTLVFDLSP
jgi:alpha-amylase